MRKSVSSYRLACALVIFLVDFDCFEIKGGAIRASLLARAAAFRAALPLASSLADAPAFDKGALAGFLAAFFLLFVATGAGVDLVAAGFFAAAFLAGAFFTGAFFTAAFLAEGIF